MYTDQAIDRLRFIKQAQRLGLTPQEIHDLVSYRTSRGLKRCRDVRDMLRSKMADLEARIAELQALQVTLSRYLADCERTRGGEVVRCSSATAMRRGSAAFDVGDSPSVAFTGRRPA